MTDRPTGTPPGIAVGTRVRPDAAFPPGTAVKYRDDLVNLFGTGIVQSGSDCFDGQHVLVRWNHRPEPDWEAVVNLEVVAPPVPVSTAPADLWDGPLTISTEYVYAPERILAPGIVQSEDTCGGKPRLANTRMPTDTARSWPDYAAYHAAYPHITPGEYERAACFEAGVRWAKERRKAQKKAKGGKHAATEGR